MPKRYLVAVLALSTASLLIACTALVVALRAESRARESAGASSRDADIQSILQNDGLRRRSVESSVPPTTVPSGTLTVHEDGCGVIRSEFDVNPDGLGWTVRDQDGFQVLKRNAAGETRYRYFRSGTFTVVLEAWGGESSMPISNEVTINC